MKKLDIELLRRICETPGAPGFEDRIRNLVRKEAEPLCDEIREDSMGNLVGVRRGESRDSVMAAAHLDEIGFMVTHIDDQGFVRFTTLGGFDPKTLCAQRVIVHGREDVLGVMGSKPIHIMNTEERNKAPKIEDFFIDLGRPVEEVKECVAVGDPITRERELIEMGPCINCKSLDNRLSVYILIEALRLLKKKQLSHDFYAVFTVQEEVGIRGARAATLEISPRFGIGLDVTLAYDVPGSRPEEQVTALGKGVAVKIMDSSTICDRRMVEFMKNQCETAKIPWQPEILKGGGTDTAGLQLNSPGGSIAGAISVPTRHIHQVIEMAHGEDVKGAIKLLTRCVTHIGKGNWDR